MRVSRLEIFGFKSFVEPLALNFDHPLIAIVGPNGCGKSNVVDALRWVLGETQARQLRGGTFEDLIFNGSDQRKPLGMAEVTLTIRPHEGWAANLPEKLLVVREQELAEAQKAIEELGMSVPESGVDSIGVGANGSHNGAHGDA